MTFIKYQHVERFGTSEVEGLVDLDKPCYVFPKIDGTNGSIWCEDGQLCFGSRNRQLSLDNDNQGFMESLYQDSNVSALFDEYPDIRLYGEWLVPHTLKDYEDAAWRQFYVFDVVTHDGQYLYYDLYKLILDKYGIEYIPPLAIVERGTEERFRGIMENNSYLMQEGGKGEGIVIKRYDFVNKYGRVTWAKMVRDAFKSKHTKTMGPQRFAAKAEVEESIVADFVTQALVDKVQAKIIADNGGDWQSKLIPKLLHIVFYDLVREECWNFVKKHKNPTVDFKRLQQYTLAHVKQLKPEIFA